MNRIASSMGYPMKTGPLKIICGGLLPPAAPSFEGPTVFMNAGWWDGGGLSGGKGCVCFKGAVEKGWLAAGMCEMGGCGGGPPLSSILGNSARPGLSSRILVWSNGHLDGLAAAALGVRSGSGEGIRTGAGGDAARSTGSSGGKGTEMPQGLLGDSPTLTSFKGLSK